MNNLVGAKWGQKTSPQERTPNWMDTNRRDGQRAKRSCQFLRQPQKRAQQALSFSRFVLQFKNRSGLTAAAVAADTASLIKTKPQTRGRRRGSLIHEESLHFSLSLPN